jgi:SAM-dependent methyltransferase
MAELHPLAATGFGGGDLYDRARPPYPAAIAAALELPDGARVLDLAAGTGKVTRALRAAGLDVVAVEPNAVLRAPDALDGTAEAIPLPDASVDAITVGDAWHWFDHDRAIPEVARVLRGGGLLALLTQRPRVAEAPPWLLDAYRRLVELRGDHPFWSGDGWERLRRDERFGDVQERAVPFAWELDRDAFAAYVSTFSYVVRLPDDQRHAVIEQARSTSPEDTFSLPYESALWLTRRRG